MSEDRVASRKCTGSRPRPASAVATNDAHYLNSRRARAGHPDLHPDRQDGERRERLRFSTQELFVKNREQMDGVRRSGRRAGPDWEIANAAR